MDDCFLNRLAVDTRGKNKKKIQKRSAGAIVKKCQRNSTSQMY